jgi:2'-5' RNA ligase
LVSEQWRLFIALALPKPAHERVRAAQVAARGAGFDARWVAPELAHLTLKFLGDTDPSRVNPLATRLRDIVLEHARFTIGTGSLGAFPNPQRPRILWLGLAGDLAPLHGLYGAIDAGLAPIGFPREARPFRPHLTLGRLHERSTAPPREALARAQNTLGNTMLPIPVTEVLLMRSELGRGGPRYTTVDSFPLAI